MLGNVFTALGHAGPLADIYRYLCAEDQYNLAMVSMVTPKSLGLPTMADKIGGDLRAKCQYNRNNVWHYMPGLPLFYNFYGRLSDTERSYKTLRTHPVKPSMIHVERTSGLASYADAAKKLRRWAPRAVDIVRRYPDAWLAGGLVERALAANAYSCGNSDADIFILGEDAHTTAAQILSELPSHYEIRRTHGREYVLGPSGPNVDVVTILIPADNMAEQDHEVYAYSCEIFLQLIVYAGKPKTIDWCIEDFDFDHLQVAYSGDMFVMSMCAPRAITTGTTAISMPTYTRIKPYRIYKTILRGYVLKYIHGQCCTAGRGVPTENIFEDGATVDEKLMRCVVGIPRIRSCPTTGAANRSHYYRTELAKYYPTDLYGVQEVHP